MDNTNTEALVNQVNANLEYYAKFFSILMSTMCRLESFKAENEVRYRRNESPAYSGDAFLELERDMLQKLTELKIEPK